jgi:hypothetical protein
VVLLTEQSRSAALVASQIDYFGPPKDMNEVSLLIRCVTLEISHEDLHALFSSLFFSFVYTTFSIRRLVDLVCCFGLILSPSCGGIWCK